MSVLPHDKERGFFSHLVMTLITNETNELHCRRAGGVWVEMNGKRCALKGSMRFSWLQPNFSLFCCVVLPQHVMSTGWSRLRSQKQQTSNRRIGVSKSKAFQSAYQTFLEAKY